MRALPSFEEHLGSCGPRRFGHGTAMPLEWSGLKRSSTRFRIHPLRAFGIRSCARTRCGRLPTDLPRRREALTSTSRSSSRRTRRTADAWRAPIMPPLWWNLHTNFSSPLCGNVTSRLGLVSGLDLLVDALLGEREGVRDLALVLELELDHLTGLPLQDRRLEVVVVELDLDLAGRGRRRPSSRGSRPAVPPIVVGRRLLASRCCLRCCRHSPRPRRARNSAAITTTP